MIGIEGMAGYVPAGRIDNFTRCESFGVEESFVTQKIGVTKVAVMEKGQETSDLCCKAVNALDRVTPLKLANIECLIVCTQNPDTKGLPHTSAIVHHKLGIARHCAAFDISLGCSGYVYSLSVIHAFMTANSYRKGLLITCDPYSKIVDPGDKSTAMLFGDAATATLLGNNPFWKIGKAVFGTDGEGWQAIHVGSNGKLSMQGRAVFNFAATTIPSNITETLKKNGLVKDEIDLFALHQGSKFIIDILRKRMKIPVAKLPFVAETYGNTVSSSIPMILKDAGKEIQNVLISGFGVGFSWGSMLLKRVREENRYENKC